MSSSGTRETWEIQQIQNGWLVSNTWTGTFCFLTLAEALKYLSEAAEQNAIKECDVAGNVVRV